MTTRDKFGGPKNLLLSPYSGRGRGVRVFNPRFGWPSPGVPGEGVRTLPPILSCTSTMNAIAMEWLLTLAAICGMTDTCLAQAPFAGDNAKPTAQPAVLNDVGIDQKLGEQVPGDLIFRDDAGQRVLLGDYFGKRPLILALVYYKCPMLCTMVLNDLTKSLNGMNLTAGRQFDILTVSFDPHETPALAAEKKRQYLRAYRRDGAETGWHFLTGPQDSIDRLTRSVGFRYAWDPQYQVFAHASGIMILTPQGKVSRYFFGIDYVPSDLRLSLVEASNRTISTPADTILLYCFHYDPRTGRYGLIISRALQIGGAITLLIVGGGIFLMLKSPGRHVATETIDPHE